MTFELVLPSVSGNSKTTKDYILSILIKESPLTVRQIENRIKKSYGHSVTYQAVRKAIFYFLDEEVLTKEGKDYSINGDWINRLSLFCKCLSDGNVKEFNNIWESEREGDFLVLYFDSIKERKDYLNKFERQIIPTLKNKKILVQIPHGYSAFNQEFIKERMDFLNKHGIKMYRIYKQNTFIDKLSASLYKKYGAKVEFNTKDIDNSWIIIYGDVIVQTIQPSEMKAMDKELFCDLSKIDEDSYKYIELYLYKKMKIKTIVQKNEDLAEKSRKEMLSYFNNKKIA